MFFVISYSLVATFLDLKSAKRAASWAVLLAFLNFSSKLGCCIEHQLAKIEHALSLEVTIRKMSVFVLSFKTVQPMSIFLKLYFYFSEQLK